MNPTYEELERKIAVLDFQLNLSLIAERAWETTMMLACGEDGPKSVADKFAELQAKCAGLAAENACLKQSLEEVSEAFETGTDGALAAAVDESLNLLTPETDAVLKRIQAQGVAMFASKCKEESKRAHSSDYRDSWWVSGENAEDFAAQLRQDANTSELEADGIITKVGE